MLSVDQRYRYVYKPLIWIAALAPAALMVAAIAGFGPFELGAEPARKILHTCGKTALNLLLLTLCVTPLRQLLHKPNLQRLRRLLGLFAFFYAATHFVVYAWLDQGLDVNAIVEDIVKRPYITIGMLGLLLLIPLAATSTQAMMRRLRRRWQTLHRLVYVIAILGVWHYYWQVKKDIREPLIYAGILALLLGYRVWRGPVRRRLEARRAARATSPSAPATAQERT